MDCHALFQGIFTIQESNPCLLHLLHWQAGSLPRAPSEKLQMKLFPSPGDLPNPGIEPMSLTSLALADGFFPTSPIWEDPIRLKAKTKIIDIIHLCVDIGSDELMIEHLPGRRRVNIACPQRWGRICTTICDTLHIHFISVLLLLKWDFTLFRIHAVSEDV